jgi:acyl-coenzyme A synthetase/AMP-(fatty) acid ligase
MVKTFWTPTHIADEFILKIVSWLEEKVVPYKRLRGGIEFVNEIPKNSS